MIVDSRGREIEGNGVDMTQRQREKALRMNCTVGEASDIAHAHAVQAMNHLGNQLPAFVHKIVSEAIKGYHESLIERGIVPAEGLIPVIPSKEELMERWRQKQEADRQASHAAEMAVSDGDDGPDTPQDATP